jgi:hypothetical protein
MKARRKGPNRLIAVHANSRAMTSPTRGALGRLGYELVRADGERFHDSDPAPDMRIVDERLFDEIPSIEAEPSMPLVVLTGVRPLTDVSPQREPRIVGRIARPAGLTPLYGLLQQTLEDTPRRVPRVPTRLPARWVRCEKLSIGAILSLSERGCLLRTTEDAIEQGMRMQLQFALPGAGLLSMNARCIHGSGSDIGLSFHEPASSMRNAISGFVSELLSAS